jgi:hypothetical protein
MKNCKKYKLIECTNKLLAIIDWQCSHSGNPMEDLSRLLISSTPATIRQAHTDFLIAFFYARTEFYFGKELKFSIEDLHRAYKFAFPYSTMFYLFTVPYMAANEVIVGTEEKLKAIRQESLYNRVKVALDDCDAYKCVFDEIMKSVP